MLLERLLGIPLSVTPVRSCPPRRLQAPSGCGCQLDFAKSWGGWQARPSLVVRVALEAARSKDPCPRWPFP